MKEFLKDNFESFQACFEESLGCQLCPWIEENIVIKKSMNHKRAIKIPKWFLCNVLLKEPDEEVISKCEELFPIKEKQKANNINNRTSHQYVCDQIFGTLKEVYHIKRLQLKHPNIEFSLASSEFNQQTQKREIYQEGGKDRKPDLHAKFKGSTKFKAIHIKTNNVFLQTLTMRFRGGVSPEIESIKNNSESIHVLIDEDKYLNLSKHINNNNLIEYQNWITQKNQSYQNEYKHWGGRGAYKIQFKKDILKQAIQY